MLFCIKGYGKCGVAVIRVSGPKALVALEKMAKISSLKPRTAFLRKIHDPQTKEVLDKGLCLWFPGNVIQCLIQRSICRNYVLKINSIKTVKMNNEFQDPNHLLERTVQNFTFTVVQQ